MVEGLTRAGAAHGRAGRLDEAEFHLRRVVSSWPAYPLGALNLASVYLDRLRATDDPEEQARCRRTLEPLLRTAAAGEPVPHPIVHEKLVRLAMARGDDDQARVQLALLRAHADATEEDHAIADELEQWLDGGYRRYDRGSELVMPHLRLAGRPASPDAAARRALGEGCALLEDFAEDHASHWQSRWLLGKAHEALGDQEGALTWLLAAMALEPPNPDVGRELALQQMIAGTHDAAVATSRKALALAPQDPTLMANLALALCLAGQDEEARHWVGRSRELAPGDTITSAVAELIEAVATGARERPERMLPGGRLP